MVVNLSNGIYNDNSINLEGGLRSMSDSKRLTSSISRDLYILDDESNPRGSNVNRVYGSTILDQVFDPLSPTNKNLRQILEDLKQEIITGGKGNIVFPVTSVNRKTEDVVITATDLGLGSVDNTRDINKPLSKPQREAVMEILSGYNFHANFDDLYAHLQDTSNPHDVSIEDINKNDVLQEFVQRYIAMHNNSGNTSIHMDIRRSLSTLWNLVDDINNNLEDRVGNVLKAMDEHQADKLAHLSLFNEKEDVKNKTIAFTTTTNNDHTKYPTTRAVVEFVTQRLLDFKDTLPDLKDWISDIVVVDGRDNLPSPTSRYVRSAYFIRNGNTSHDEVAICRLSPDNKTYAWDISQLGSYSKFDEECFKDSIDGLTIRMDKVISAIISENGMLDTSLSDILQAYYTKEDIDNFQFVDHIKIVPGTQDGTIRYYINDDMTTMSEDVPVSGLKRLAYLEYVTEDQLWDQSVHSRHIISKAIEKRHLNDNIVGIENMTCRYGYLLGNTNDSGGENANEVSLQQLADYLRPLIGGWPDPNVPGGNPWSEMLFEQLMHPHLWETGKEYIMGDHSYVQKFTGKISVLPNKNYKIHLTDKISLGKYRMIETGGTWQYQTNPDEWTMLGGSNITGHTFATVNMTKDGLFFESISIGDRFEAEYDIWVKYIIPEEIEQLVHPSV